MFTIKNILEELPHPSVPEQEVFSCHNFKIVSGCMSSSLGHSLGQDNAAVEEVRLYMYDEQGDLIRNFHIQHRAYIINCNGKTVDVITPN